jgi:hypothetical protein
LGEKSIRERLDLSHVETNQKNLPGLTIQRSHLQPHALSTPPSAPPVHYSSLFSSLLAVKGRILQELETNLPRLLTLNRTRRESISLHLSRLAGLRTSILPEGSTAKPKSVPELKDWIEGHRTPSQSQALRTFFEEIALMMLGQSLLLKAWADRGHRAWTEEDLGRLNWALSQSLKPFVPLDREGWQVTRPNLYSWYTPSAPIQRELWATFEEIRITDEGPGLLTQFFSQARQVHPESLHGASPSSGDGLGYDTRFFESIWNNLAEFGVESFDAPPTHPTGFRRNRMAFSPTLRDGSLVRTGPATLSWIGTESSTFQLMVAELAQLWWGPSAPPLWAVGTGLEVHSREQLALALGSPKPSLFSRIAEMEACEISFVLEERVQRLSHRSPEMMALKELLDELPYFKRLRSAGTTLGDLQACIAISKLRPGGAMVWARNEPLSGVDGQETLAFLLDRAKLVCEWDFSELDHALPGKSALFPKYLYLFSRDPRMETRASHRPLRVSLQGQIRSHVELPLVFSDAWRAVSRELSPHGHWKIVRQQSPSAQKDWAERWPGKTNTQTIAKLDSFKQSSLPLAQIATIKLAPSDRNGGATKVHASLKGFCIHAQAGKEGERFLEVAPLSTQSENGGVMVLLPEESWVAPLSCFLRSEIVSLWLDQNAERKGTRWQVTEQLVRWIPIPRVLLSTLGFSEASPTPATPLPGDWERLACEVAHQPRTVLQAVHELLKAKPPEMDQILSAVFVRTARALETIGRGQAKLLSLVSAEGQIRWRELLEILPPSECISITIQPQLRLSGSIPPHLPIHRIDRTKSPEPGILLATETGFNLHLTAEDPILIEMVWEQIRNLTHPTWSELVQFVKVPRKVELAQITATDVIRSHGLQSKKVDELSSLLSACQLH